MLSEIIQGGKGLSQILNGFNNSRAAKKIAGIQREIAGMQLKYNKKQAKEATETNLRGMLRQYASARESLYEQKENVRMNLNFKSQMKGVEKKDNSYITDSKNKLESEFFENMRNTIENQKNDSINISKQGIDQVYQAQGSYNQAITNINGIEIQARQQANQMILNGITDVAMAGISAYKNFNTKSELPTDDSSKEQRVSKVNFSKPYSFNRGFDSGFGRPKLSLGGGF